ncbi:MAG: hypothetical protein JXR52_10515 [Bacteroidales bacterium]|nr:hypothetical protein [Bacteroidales bacterium]
MVSRLVLSAILLGITLTGYTQFRVGAELRPRVIVDNGYSIPKTKESRTHVYVSQRTRFNATFAGEFVETYLSVQDVRIWGDDDNFSGSGQFGNTRSISLHQGWVLLKPAEWISIKIGRQLFSYDDTRILASRNWNDYQVTYDALLIKAGNSENSLDIGISKNAESSKYTILPQQKFTTFDFLRYERSREAFKWSAIALLTGNPVNDTTDEIRYRSTYGTNLSYSGEGVDAHGSFYFQHNLNDSGGRLRAFCGAVNVGREVLPGKLKLSLGLDYISGQDETKADPEYLRADHAFDLLYGNRHGKYGYMDYFSRMPAQGLQDYLFKSEYRFAKNLLLQADYHYFRLAAGMFDPADPSTELSRELGHEVDLTFQWKMTKEATLQAGYSFFLTAPTLEAVKGVTNSPLKFPQFAYLMLTVKPEFSFASGNQ